MKHMRRTGPLGVSLPLAAAVLGWAASAPFGVRAGPAADELREMGDAVGIAAPQPLPIAASPKGDSFEISFPSPDAVQNLAEDQVRMNGETIDPGIIRQLRAKQIEMTVAVYGSARVLPPEKASQRLMAATAAWHRSGSAEDRDALDQARQAMKLSAYYLEAMRFGALAAKYGRGKVAVVTGGGPGIMEAANRGAFEAGAPSVGYCVRLPFEDKPNDYLTPGLSFYFDNFALRQAHDRYGAVALVFFPGGIGTIAELSEVLTLIQTGKMPRIPIVLVGEKFYWDKALRIDHLVDAGLMSRKDLSLFTFADTAQQAWNAIAQSMPALGPASAAQ